MHSILQSQEGAAGAAQTSPGGTAAESSGGVNNAIVQSLGLDAQQWGHLAQFANMMASMQGYPAGGFFPNVYPQVATQFQMHAQASAPGQASPGVPQVPPRAHPAAAPPAQPGRNQPDNSVDLVGRIRQEEAVAAAAAGVPPGALPGNTAALGTGGDGESPVTLDLTGRKQKTNLAPQHSQ